MKTISPKQLYESEQNGSVDVIDVRTPAEYGHFHAPCARNVPLDSLDVKKFMASRNGSAHQPLYVICQGGNRSSQACKKFIDAGFENVVNVDGGTLAWEAAGLPLIRGKKAIAIDRQMRIVAGSLVLAGALAAQFGYPQMIWLSGFVGAGLIFAGVTNICPMMNVIARMPWNQGQQCGSCTT